MSVKYNAILLFGYPGCGKGTQGLTLAGMPNFCHLAMGEIFRGIDRESTIGREFLSYSTRGNLVPDELTIRVWKSHIEKLVANGSLRADYHVLLLDGLPRTPTQVELLQPCIEVLKIIHLRMDDREKLMKRLRGRAASSNRPDDAKDEVILNRIRVYESETAPVLKCYPPDLVAEINADQPPLSVLADICRALAPVVPANI